MVLSLIIFAFSFSFLALGSHVNLKQQVLIQRPLVNESSTIPPSKWQHPGYVVDKTQLDFIKEKVSTKSEPWTTAYNRMVKDTDEYGAFATGSRKSKAGTTVSCGPQTNPDIHCREERSDALAAWANALAWYISGNVDFAKNAIQLMNKWSYVIKSHELDNAVLQTAWAGASWARSGELIRHTTSGLWSVKDVTQFEDMLRNVYLPLVRDGSTRTSNWDIACLNTAIGIAIFLEDASVYEHAMTLFQKTVPSAIYLESDGNIPHAAHGTSLDPSEIKKRWCWKPTGKPQICQQSWGHAGQNGQVQETCRDFVHTGYTISSISHVLETSRIQGVDQYSGDLGTRLRFALGFHSRFEEGAKPPSWLCDNRGLNLGLEYVTEIGLNAMSYRLGNPMPATLKYTETHRPLGTNFLFYGWETLTHAQNTA